MCATFFHNFGWAENCRLCSRAKVKLASIKLPFFFQKKYPLFKGKSPWTFDSRKTFLFTTVFENLHKCLIWIFTQKFKFKPSLKINAKLIFFLSDFQTLCPLFANMRIAYFPEKSDQIWIFLVFSDASGWLHSLRSWMSKEKDKKLKMKMRASENWETESICPWKWKNEKKGKMSQFSNLSNSTERTVKQ